jgi:hypothetical protein
MSTNAAATMRRRAPPQGDEEAGAELKLGEFQDVDALTHSEAALVINALVAKRKMEKDGKRANDSEYVSLPAPPLSCVLSAAKAGEVVGEEDEEGEGEERLLMVVV